MYLHYKFQAKQTKDAKVMSKKPPIGGQGGKEKDKYFLQSPKGTMLHQILSDCHLDTFSKVEKKG